MSEKIKVEAKTRNKTKKSTTEPFRGDPAFQKAFGIFDSNYTFMFLVVGCITFFFCCCLSLTLSALGN